MHPFKTLTRCIFYYNVRCQFFKCIFPSENLNKGMNYWTIYWKCFLATLFKWFLLGFHFCWSGVCSTSNTTRTNWSWSRKGQWTGWTTSFQPTTWCRTSSKSKKVCNRIAALALCLLLDGKLVCPAPKQETLALYKSRGNSFNRNKKRKVTIYWKVIVCMRKEIGVLKESNPPKKHLLSLYISLCKQFKINSRFFGHWFREEKIVKKNSIWAHMVGPGYQIFSLWENHVKPFQYKLRRKAHGPWYIYTWEMVIKRCNHQLLTT